MAKHIENLTENPNELAQVLGIGNVANANLEYPYILTQVGHKLGYKGWHGAHKLMQAVVETQGIDVKANDNEYHWAFKSGQNTITHKYSEKFVELLAKVQADSGGKSDED